MLSLLSLRYSNAMESERSFRRSIEKIVARICVARAFATSEKSLAQLHPLADARDAVCSFVGKKKEERERSSRAVRAFDFAYPTPREREREVMAHFVKLIGSLERHGSELVPLNFSSDYTKELTR